MTLDELRELERRATQRPWLRVSNDDHDYMLARTLRNLAPELLAVVEAAEVALNAIPCSAYEERKCVEVDPAGNTYEVGEADWFVNLRDEIQALIAKLEADDAE